LAFLEEEEIELLPWPLRSPDLSPIEKVWDTMGRFIYNLSYPPITLEEVQGAIAEAWEGTPQEFIDSDGKFPEIYNLEIFPAKISEIFPEI
jgi:transposase